MTTVNEVNEALSETEGVSLTENSSTLGGMLAVVFNDAIGHFYKACRENDFEHEGSRLNEDLLVVRIEIDQLDEMFEQLDAPVSETDPEDHKVEQ